MAVLTAPLYVCMLIALALALALPMSSAADRQMVRARGVLKCNGTASSDDSVHLVDGYGTSAKKVHLTKVTTNKDGSFELKGSRPINKSFEPWLHVMTTCHSPSKYCVRRLTWKIPQCYAFPESWLDRDSNKPALVDYNCPAERWFELNVDLFNMTENTECYSGGGR